MPRGRLRRRLVLDAVAIAAPIAAAAIAVIAAVLITLAAAALVAAAIVVISFVTTAIVVALCVGGCGRPGCRAQGGDGRDEGFFHLRLPCAPSPAHPRKDEPALARLNPT